MCLRKNILLLPECFGLCLAQKHCSLVWRTSDCGLDSQLSDIGNHSTQRQVTMVNSEFEHTRFTHAHGGQMFSCVQEPPLPATLSDSLWHGRQVGNTREQTTVCIKGMPGRFVADQPESTGSGPVNDPRPDDVHQNHQLSNSSASVQHLPVAVDAQPANQSGGTNDERAKCQRAVTNLFNVSHPRNSFERNSFERLKLPLIDHAFDSLREALASEVHPELAEEVIKYWQVEADKLLSRNVQEADLYYEICGCSLLDPETQKYIKSTLFTVLSESRPREFK